MTKTLKSITFHTLFWCGVWLFFNYFFSYNSTNLDYVAWFSSFLLPVTMAITYTTIYFLIPRYLLTGKHWLFLLYAVYTFVISTYTILWTVILSFVFMTQLKIAEVPPMSRNFIFIIILVYLIVFVVSFVYLLNFNHKITEANSDLKNQFLDAQLQIKSQELAYLKKQIHPHFLFNTLNTIYGLALEKSNVAPDVIIKLTNLLDYILYQEDQQLVKLKKEIEHIEDYVDLEKIRFRDNLEVDINSSEVSENIQIAPMLFLPFVENAFKHGRQIENKLTILIDFATDANTLVFRISNTTKTNQMSSNKQGIGLKNVEKRLQHIYKEKFDLDYALQDNLYMVTLTLHDIIYG